MQAVQVKESEFQIDDFLKKYVVFSHFLSYNALWKDIKI